MKEYILSIIGAAVLSSFSSMLSPDKWRKYIGVITGLVVISCIISPLSKFSKTDLFKGFEYIENNEQYSQNMQKEIILEEMSENIGKDISKRLLDEYGISVTAAAAVSINENNEICGIEKIRVKGARLTKTQKARLCEVYGVSEGDIKDE